MICNFTIMNSTHAHIIIINMKRPMTKNTVKRQSFKKLSSRISYFNDFDRTILYISYNLSIEIILFNKNFTHKKQEYKKKDTNNNILNIFILNT